MNFNRNIYISTVLQILAIDFAFATKRGALDEWPTSASLRLMKAHNSVIEKVKTQNPHTEESLSVEEANVGLQLDYFLIFEDPQTINKVLQLEVERKNNVNNPVLPQLIPKSPAQRKLEF